jgi:hypothetical protein
MENPPYTMLLDGWFGSTGADCMYGFGRRHYSLSMSSLPAHLRRVFSDKSEKTFRRRRL